jgi:tetratricopeptide (TPR) repeat protein
MSKQIIFIALLFIPMLLVADTWEVTLYNEAVEAYQNKQFSQALEKFMALEDEGIVNADLYYNIGNSYFRADQLGRAVVYYLKALKVDPNHHRARQNLNFALEITQDEQSLQTEDTLGRIWSAIVTTFPLNLLAIITLAILILIVLTINWMIIYYRGKEKSIPIFILTFLIVLFSISLLISIIRWNTLHDDSQAVLIADQASGYSGPSEEFTRIFTIHEGMIVTIEQAENNWLLVKLPNGTGGWMKSAELDRVRIK